MSSSKKNRLFWWVGAWEHHPVDKMQYECELNFWEHQTIDIVLRRNIGINNNHCEINYTILLRTVFKGLYTRLKPPKLMTVQAKQLLVG